MKLVFGLEIITGEDWAYIGPTYFTSPESVSLFYANYEKSYRPADCRKDEPFFDTANLKNRVRLVIKTWPKNKDIDSLHYVDFEDIEFIPYLDFEAITNIERHLIPGDVMKVFRKLKAAKM